ncbi:type III polyketide synthase, partial [Candidatus Protofrankia californiensis]|uniref:type III polyketide synthase n=1 Tax=Candidatus Protofrankia californiensis TaxID=1839754 RepID=UPI0019D19C7E
LADAPAIRNLTQPHIVGTAVATPQRVNQDDLWEFFRDHFAANPLAEKVWASSGIVSRHYAVDPRKEPSTEWTTGERMRRYLTEALPLGRQAASDALTTAGLTPSDLGLFAVASCTGHVTPGLDILLSHDLQMPPNLRRVIIGHMGCHAAIPGLGTVAEYVAVHGKPALLLCLELSSLHAQPKSPTLHAGTPTREDLEQIVAHSLFADGAAAVVVAPFGRTFSTDGAASLEILDVTALTDSSVSEYMGLLVTDHGFRMRLSPQVPEVLERHVADLVTNLLTTHGYTSDDVDGWAIHPGGARILRVVAEQLQLSDEAIAPSYDVLREYGNCSSATVLIVLQRLLQTREIRPGKVVVALGFGPGLTLFAALLKAH